MPSVSDIRRVFDQAVRGAEDRQWIQGRLGMVNLDGSVTIVVPGRTNWVYVALGPEGAQGVTMARNDGHVPHRVFLPVKMRRERDGALVVHGVWSATGLADETKSADPVNPYGVDPHPHAFLELTDTPATFLNHANDLVRVQITEETLEFVTIGTIIGGGDEVFPPQDVSMFPYTEGAILKSISWGSVKSTLVDIFDTLYAPIGIAADDHGGLTGLGDDDHTQYILASGTRPLTGDWDIGTGRKIKAEKLGARSATGLRLEDDGGNLGVFVKDSNGYVGIMTASPIAALHVQNDYDYHTDSLLRLQSQNDSVAWFNFVDIYSLVGGTSHSVFSIDKLGHISIGGGIQDADLYAPGMIVAMGRVGIGTLAPTVALDVVGAIKAGDGTRGLLFSQYAMTISESAWTTVTGAISGMALIMIQVNSSSTATSVVLRVSKNGAGALDFGLVSSYAFVSGDPGATWNIGYQAAGLYLQLKAGTSWPASIGANVGILNLVW